MSQRLQSGSRKRKSFSVATKLAAIEFAKSNSYRKAALHFGVDESCIRMCKKNEQQLNTVPNKSKNTLNKIPTAEMSGAEGELKKISS